TIVHVAVTVVVAMMVVVAVAVVFPPASPRRPPAGRRVVTPVRPLMRPRVVGAPGHSKDRLRDVLGRQLRPGPIVPGTDIPAGAEEDEVLPVIGKEVRSDGRSVLDRARRHLLELRRRTKVKAEIHAQLSMAGAGRTADGRERYDPAD